MINEKIKTDILVVLYEARLFESPSALTISEIARKLPLEEKTIADHCRLLLDDWAVRLFQRSEGNETSDVYWLSANGIYEVEATFRRNAKPADQEKIAKNEAIRKALLEAIQELREEFSSPHGSAQQMSPEFKAAYDQKIEDKKLDRLLADRNFYYLTESHYITEDSRLVGGDFFYRISNSGYQLLKDYEVQEKQISAQAVRVSTFEVLKSGVGLTLQARGHALERLLKPILENEGWNCELNVKTPSQENDLIVHQGREYIIVECKWEEAKKASPEYVSRLRDKIRDRPGFSTGILISMSGFTSSVADSVRNRLSDCMIILFSRQDIEDIVYGRRTFTDLLNERFHAAMSRTEVIIRDDNKAKTPKSPMKKAKKKAHP